MADGRRADEWARTAELLALLANCHRDKAKRATPYRARDFNPYAKRQKPTKVPITVLKDVFIDGKYPKTEGD